MKKDADIKLTKFSHGSGCGCKLSPEILNRLVGTNRDFRDPMVLVGNNTSDDAVVYDLGNDKAIISTTDFFTPIVDDPYDFGNIAAVNALSDVYAMGGTPLVAIAILGWPVDKIDPDIAGIVLDGARDACKNSGIEMAGGHSIDNPEPVFGLAVTGMVEKLNLKKNSTAREGSSLYITKPLGVGLISNAHKKGIVNSSNLEEAIESMKKLNTAGQEFGKLPIVNAMTDVTGFGLLGHLIELCEASQLSAKIYVDALPKFRNLDHYIENRTIPGGTGRNWKSYGTKVSDISEDLINLLADPQTSGGLLVSVDENSEMEFETYATEIGLSLSPIGSLTKSLDKVVYIK